ncbi:hypothetical protein MKX01_011041, partial [Papaver californicum]
KLNFSTRLFSFMPERVLNKTVDRLPLYLNFLIKHIFLLPKRCNAAKKEDEDKPMEEEDIAAVCMVGKVLEDTQSNVRKRKLNAWNAEIVSKGESGNQLSLKDTNVDLYDDHENMIESSHHPTVSVNTAELDEIKLSEGLQKQSISTVNNVADKIVSTVNDEAEKNSAEVEVVEVKQSKCITCNASVGYIKQYHEHFKSEWHKHNLRRKTRQLPPLTADECLASIDMGDAKSDLKDHCRLSLAEMCTS